MSSSPGRHHPPRSRSGWNPPGRRPLTRRVGHPASMAGPRSRPAEWSRRRRGWRCAQVVWDVPFASEPVEPSVPLPAPPPGQLAGAATAVGGCRRSAAGRRAAGHPAASHRAHGGGPKSPSPSAVEAGRRRRAVAAGGVVVGDRPRAAAAPPTAPRPRPTTRAPTASPRPLPARPPGRLVAAAVGAAGAHGRHRARPGDRHRGGRMPRRHLRGSRAPTQGSRWGRPRPAAREWQRTGSAGSGQQVGWVMGAPPGVGDDLATTIRSHPVAGLWRAQRPAGSCAGPLTGTAQGTHGLASVRTTTMGT